MHKNIKNMIKKVCISVLAIILVNNFLQVIAVGEEKSKNEIAKVINDMFMARNKAILNNDLENIAKYYDLSTKYGTWAYEYEVRKVKYIQHWQDKQNAKFIEIVPNVMIKRIKGSGDTYSAILTCCTEYKYAYNNTPEIINTCRIGTYHTLRLNEKDGEWVLNKEWYKDPFADSLNLDNIKYDSIKEYIASQAERDLSAISDRRKAAVEYATKYCGLAGFEENGFKYNKKYRDYNPMGGDCANFASQILFEGGKFKKNSAWNYDGRGATAAWLNADSFKRYMVYSGRASVIAYGNYDKVFKAAYKLLPGDFVAYEKKGDITHISVVAGADSNGYSLVTCHNTDRYMVPWDLGWSDKKIKFWLVKVNY
ncbi:amidase domain-containing protein [Clostridium sp. 19966]|uniref:amidase domain-containing protein n=1 Tax=Clostridium sp. 19966 TaxID=2768166 RepID=UPI0028DFA7FF|nr:amidase domain-containing protein [Clostridium sp. 19966]MDT8716783.1 amidase domain-containing protein [Clostridium sp. 19966]